MDTGSVKFPTQTVMTPFEPEFQTKTIPHMEGTERSTEGLLKVMRRALAKGA